MIFSENWLREWVNPAVDRAELLQRLTMAGLEVESVQVLGAGLDGVVVGEIVAAEPHPNADRLRVCQVAIGAGATVQIVCGAPNARVGLKAPLATIGATLPNGLAIKAAALRGVDSQGMLCSAHELALSEDSNGLLELPGDAPTGQALAAYLGLPDAAIEIKLTPNRPDCLGLRGLACDVAALFDVAPTPPELAPVPAQSQVQRAVRLEAGADCPRYLGRVIEAIDPLAPSPLWLIERLRRAGLRSISAVVDVTNYVMLELGQPMHAFDQDRLDGAIVVRPARAGETLTLLDGRTVELEAGFLLIADERQALALAGVMGGADARVTDATRNIFLESAHFAPAAIMGRARKLGLHTDASHRFERGVDPELPRLALERATELLIAIAGGTPGPVVEATLAEFLPRRPAVLLRRARLARVLGMQVADAEVGRILRALGMEVVDEADGWRATPPARRFDIEIEEDLIEEIARVHGYERVPVNAPGGRLRLVLPPEAELSPSRVRAALTARGYFEAINYSFVAAPWLARWQLAENAIELANPLSAELAVMRTSLLPGLVESLRHNRNRQQERVRLFELGGVFHAGAQGPQQTLRLAALACGSAASEQWAVPRRALDFYDLKADLESVLALTGESGAFSFRPGDASYLHPGRSAALWRNDERIGVLGNLHPRLAKALDLDTEVFAFELDFAVLARTRIPRAQDLSRFPSVRRDIAVLVPEATAYGAVEASVRAALGSALVQVLVFDQYAGANLGPGVKSLAIGLILQESSRTLTDDDADRCVASALAALERECKAKLRG